MRETDPIFVLCERPIPGHARQYLHHIDSMLRSGKGGPRVLLLQIFGIR